jgi:hypothetical protein
MPCAYNRKGSPAIHRAKAVMLYKLGRLLQIVGMIMLPMAMAGNLLPQPAVTLSGMLSLMVLGVLIFFIGWSIQEIGKRK